MTTITFDTLKFAKYLEAGGVPPKQAEAFVMAQQEILSDVLDSTLATRTDLDIVERGLHSDLEKIRIDIAELKGEFKLVKWMLGIVVGGIIMIALKIYFPV